MAEPAIIACASRDEWLTVRESGIGASDAPAVLGVSPFSSPFRLYCEKLGLAERPVETERMQWGLLLEPILATRYAQETGRPVTRYPAHTLLRSAEHPFMLATLDGMTGAPGRGPGVLEIKTTGYVKQEEWADEPPLHVQVQVQHQLAVRGWAWGSIAVLIAGQRFLWCDVERNDPFIALLIEREQAFMDRLARLEPPTPDASVKDLMAKLYPRDSGQTVALPAEALDWHAKREEAVAQLKHWESLRDEAEVLLKGCIGEASIGLLPDGTRYSWKQQTRHEPAREARDITFRTLRRLSK